MQERARALHLSEKVKTTTLSPQNYPLFFPSLPKITPSSSKILTVLPLTSQGSKRKKNALERLAWARALTLHGGRLQVWGRIGDASVAEVGGAGEDGGESLVRVVKALSWCVEIGKATWSGPTSKVESKGKLTTKAGEHQAGTFLNVWKQE